MKKDRKNSVDIGRFSAKYRNLGETDKNPVINFVHHEEKSEKARKNTKMAFTDLTDCDNINNAGISCEYQIMYTRFRQKSGTCDN